MHNAHVRVRAMCERMKGAVHVHGCIELFFMMWRKSLNQPPHPLPPLSLSHKR